MNTYDTDARRLYVGTFWGNLRAVLRRWLDRERELVSLRNAVGMMSEARRADVEKLEAEVEALRADAERWEHARSIACFTEDRDMGPGGWWTVAVYVKRRPAANTIDAAVDAARAAQGDKT